MNSKRPIIMRFSKRLHCLNSPTGKKQTSYKYVLFKSILDNVYNVNNTTLSISFDILGETFAKVYWNLLNSMTPLPQPTTNNARKMVIEQVIEKCLKNHPNNKFVRFESLNDADQKEFIQLALKGNGGGSWHVNVAGALYGEFLEIIYGFDRSSSVNKLWFSKESLEFLRNNKSILDTLNSYSWILYTERICDQQGISLTNVAKILDESTKSDKRHSLTIFKEKLLSLGEDAVCFYCGKKLKDEIHVDHFVPWSFVKIDDAWNMVLSCRHCNCDIKRAKLPDKELLEKILKRNEKYGLETDKLKILYESAKYNGLRIWTRNNKKR